MFSLSDRSDKVRDAFLLAAAADDEAGRLGHAEIDTDHLLLGLVAMRGPAGRLLERHGVTLERARLAVAAVQREDLAALGIQGPEALPEPPASYAADIKPLTPAAAAIAYADLGGGLAVLGRLLADPQSLSARVLAHLGVEITEGELTAPQPDPAVAHVTGEWQSTFSTVTTVGRDRIWALLDAPERRPSWDTDVREVVVVDDEHFVGRTPVDDEDSRLSRLIARGIDIDVHYHLSVRERGRVIQWRIVMPKRAHTEHLRIELDDADGGTRLTLAHRDERRSRFGARLLRWMSAGQLRLRAQAIIQASG